MNGHGSPSPQNRQVYTIESAEYFPVAPAAVEGWTFAGWTPASIPAGSTGEFTFTANWIEATTPDNPGNPDNPEIPDEPEDIFSEDPEMQEIFGNIDEEHPIPENVPSYSQTMDGSNEHPEYNAAENEENSLDDMLNDALFGEGFDDSDKLVSRTEIPDRSPFPYD